MVSKEISTVKDLAIFGADPAFSQYKMVGVPNIGNRGLLFSYINDILDRKWLTNNGKYVKELEEKIRVMLGVKHAIAVANGTVGLEIAIRATGMTSEVIVPSFTFVATAHALSWQGIIPKFSDINRNTYTLDEEGIEKNITEKTRGIIGVHVYGQPCNIDQISQIAREHNLSLIFDAAHAFGNSYKGRPIGNFGDAEIFSFHGTKFFNTFEGGAIVTNDDDIAEKCEYMRNFGLGNGEVSKYPGTNGKMNEVSAAMGLVNLESIDEFVKINKRNHMTYRRELEGIQGINLLEYDEREKCNYQYAVIMIDENSAGLNRDDIMRVLKAEGVQTRRYFFPGVHKMEPYKTMFPDMDKFLPITEMVTARVLALPTGTSVNDEEIEKISQIIRISVAHHKDVKAKLIRDYTNDSST